MLKENSHVKLDKHFKLENLFLTSSEMIVKMRFILDRYRRYLIRILPINNKPFSHNYLTTSGNYFNFMGKSLFLQTETLGVNLRQDDFWEKSIIFNGARYCPLVHSKMLT